MMREIAFANICIIILFAYWLVGPATETIYSLVDRPTFHLCVWILFCCLYSDTYIPLCNLLLMMMMVNDKWWMMLILMKISAWHLCHQQWLMLLLINDANDKWCWWLLMNDADTNENISMTSLPSPIADAAADKWC